MASGDRGVLDLRPDQGGPAVRRTGPGSPPRPPSTAIDLVVGAAPARLRGRGGASCPGPADSGLEFGPRRGPTPPNTRENLSGLFGCSEALFWLVSHGGPR